MSHEYLDNPSISPMRRLHLADFLRVRARLWRRWCQFKSELINLSAWKSRIGFQESDLDSQIHHITDPARFSVADSVSEAVPILGKRPTAEVETFRDFLYRIRTLGNFVLKLDRTRHCPPVLCNGLENLRDRRLTRTPR